jgi:hypothetical protein
MSKHSARKASKVATPVAPAPAPETPVAPAPETPVAKAPVAKYAAPGAVLANMVITTVVSNPKQPRSKSYARYAKFHRAGQLVADFIAAYKAAGHSSTLAWLDLRWDLAHGFITVETPAPQTPETPAQ